MTRISSEQIDNILDGALVLENTDSFIIKKITVGYKREGLAFDQFEVVGKSENGGIFVAQTVNPNSFTDARFGLDAFATQLTGKTELKPDDFLIRNLQRRGLKPTQQLWVRLDLWRQIYEGSLERFPENPFDELVSDHLTAQEVRQVLTGWSN